MLKLIKGFKVLVRGANFIGILFLIPLMIIATLDVVMRGLFNHPIGGGLEMSQFIMVVIIWLTIARTTQKKGHIAMQFMESRLSTKALYFSDGMVKIVMVVMIVLVDWALLDCMVAAYQSGETTDVLKWPIYPALGVMFFGGVLTAFELLAELYTMLSAKNGNGELTGLADIPGGE